jgi:hypothetical protein
MKSTLAVLVSLAVSASAYGIEAATDVHGSPSPHRKISMKDDLGKENPKMKFVAGHWTRRPSGGRQVLVRTSRPALGSRDSRG